eukprot:350357-Pelagomonas_calceolata.AAC.1
MALLAVMVLTAMSTSTTSMQLCRTWLDFGENPARLLMRELLFDVRSLFGWRSLFFSLLFLFHRAAHAAQGGNAALKFLSHNGTRMALLAVMAVKAERQLERHSKRYKRR